MGPGADGAGADLQSQLQEMMTGRANPFGSNVNLTYEVGFNKRSVAPMTQPTADGHSQRIEFKLPSTLGHMVHNIWLRATVRLKMRDATTLKATLAGKTGPTLKAELENVNFHPDTVIGMLRDVELRHNSIVFQRLTREKMRYSAREQYNKEDHELRSRNLNGGDQPYYHYLKEGTDGSGHPTLTKAKKHLTNDDTTYINTGATDGMYDHVNSEVMDSQWKQLQKRLPHEPKYLMFCDYRPEFHTEIGLKDLSATVLTSNGSAASPGDHVSNLLGDMYWDFPIMFEIPHPWHYNLSDSFPVLNLVNDMDVIFNFRPFQEWIQNWNEVSHLCDVQILPSSVDILAHYYDIPREQWDSLYPIDRQMNFYAHEYQHWPHEQVVSIKAGEKKQFRHHVNTLDKVSRYIMVHAHDTQQKAGGTTARDHKTYNIFHKLYFEVNGEKLLTKIEQVADMLHYIDRQQFFKETKNYVPGDITYQPLGIDGNIHNPGGQVLNLRALFNNLYLILEIEGDKIEELYNSGDPYLAKDDTLPNAHSKHRSSKGSSYGFITRSGSAGSYTYTFPMTLTATALVLDLVTLEQGQLHKNQQ